MKIIKIIKIIFFIWIISVAYSSGREFGFQDGQMDGYARGQELIILKIKQHGLILDGKRVCMDV